MAEAALSLRLIGAAAIGIAVQAPIFVAVTLTFALAAFLSAASMRYFTLHRPARPQRHDAGR